MKANLKKFLGLAALGMTLLATTVPTWAGRVSTDSVIIADNQSWSWATGNPVDARSSAPGKLMMAGDEVGVQMRFDNVLDLQAPLPGGVYVNVDVALRVDHGRDPFRGDQVGGVGQTPEKKMFHRNRIHVLCP